MRPYLCVVALLAVVAAVSATPLRGGRQQSVATPVAVPQTQFLSTGSSDITDVIGTQVITEGIAKQPVNGGKVVISEGDKKTGASGANGVVPSAPGSPSVGQLPATNTGSGSEATKGGDKKKGADKNKEKDSSEEAEDSDESQESGEEDEEEKNSAEENEEEEEEE